MKNSVTISSILAALLLSVSSHPIFAQNFFLDPDFGTGGKIETPTAGFRGESIIFPNDSSATFLVGGGNSIARYWLHGNAGLYNGWGNGGVIQVPFDVIKIFVVPDGKFVAAGTLTEFDAQLEIDVKHFAVARFHSNGNLDPSFGTNGVTKFPSPTPYGGQAFDAALQYDYKIVIVGESPRYQNSESDFGIVRSTADGAIDTSFGTGGFVEVDANPTIPTHNVAGGGAKAVGMQSSGRIVVGGDFIDEEKKDRMAVVRLTSAGVLDSTFGSGGKVHPYFGGFFEHLNSLAVYPINIAPYNEEIIVTGSSNESAPALYSLAITKLFKNGGVYDLFGNVGQVLSEPVSISPYIGQDTLLRLEGIYVASEAYRPDTSTDFATYRYLSNGTLDTSFGTGGVLYADFTTGDEPFVPNDRALAVEFDANNRIIVAGSSPSGVGIDDYHLAMARYTSAPDVNPDPDPSIEARIQAIFRKIKRVKRQIKKAKKKKNQRKFRNSKRRLRRYNISLRYLRSLR